MIDHVAYGSGVHGIAPEAAPAVPSALDADTVLLAEVSCWAADDFSG